MKPQERDDLLIRIDERTQNIWRLTDQQEKHLSKINDSLLKHSTNIAVNSNNIKRVWWLMGGVGLCVVGGLLSWVLGLI